MKKDTEGGSGALIISGKRSQEKFFSNGESTRLSDTGLTLELSGLHKKGSIIQRF